MNWRENAKRTVYFCVILLLVLLLVFSGLQILESTVFYKQEVQEGANPSKTIVRNGIRYFPKQDLTVLMVLGIDQFGKVESSGSYNNSGAADMISLVIFEESTKECKVLCLNRDTILEMPVLGIGGKQAGIVRQQLAMAHTYGSGLEDSCVNTKKTVSNFLYGLDIDYYISMNMDAISRLNDAVGGVTVTVEDDFSAIDPTIPMGNVTLTGEQAINFVRTRKDISDQTNISRMDRHVQYMSGFLDALNQKLAQSNQFVLSTYDAVSDYIVTNCSSTVLSDIFHDYKDYTFTGVLTPEGESVAGEMYMEFHVDNEKLDALILQLFYAPKS